MLLRVARVALLVLPCCTATIASLQPTTAARRSVAPRSRVRAAGEYTVRLNKPLGIVFEENVAGEEKGVRVAELLQGGNADSNGRVCVGDELVATSAVIFKDKRGAGFTNWERQMITCTSMSFDGVMGAIGSNDGRYGCVDVVLKLRPTEATVPRPISRFGQDDVVEPTWTPLEGVMSADGKSLPIKAPRDNF